MSARDLIAKVASQPLRPAPIADVQQRLAKLGNQVADPFHTLLGKVALHETAGITWNDWVLAAKPTFRPGAICLGLLADGSQVWHSLTTNPLGRTTLATFGEERPVGEFMQFAALRPQPEP